MTTIAAEPIEAVDLSDLDLLDDDRAHIFCIRCTPSRPGPAIAACGEEAFKLNKPIGMTLPPNLCPGCKDVWYHPCTGCGR